MESSLYKEVSDKLEGYLCGFQDATGEVPSKIIIKKYLMETLNLSKDDLQSIFDDFCENWWSHLDG